MQKKYSDFPKLFLLVLFLLTACGHPTGLVFEEHAIRTMDWEGESLTFTPVQGSREAILAKNEAERDKPAPIFTLPVSLEKDELDVAENYQGSQVSVDVTRNGEPALTIEAGVISPINNFRGLLVVDGHWFLEVAHVEEDPNDPNAAFIIWGEVFKDGESLNQQFGYDEAFNFQILGGKPFYFIKKGDQMGYGYDGVETWLPYTHIPHYLCCSASAFNPLASENMVSFFAEKSDSKFYIELGLFE